MNGCARWIGCLALCVLAGCASAPREFRLLGAAPTGDVTPHWPPAPEQPRYVFAGELIGEGNFGVAAAEAPSLGVRVLRWIVGREDASTRRLRALVRPQTGAIDQRGRILVSDAGRRAVFVFDPAASDVQIWEQAGRGGEQMVTPVGVAALPGGEVLVADAGLARVLRLGADGRPLGSFGAGALVRPTGLARDAQQGHVYVADSAAHDIKVFADSGALLRTLGRRGGAPGEFNGPTHLALSGERLYVSDTLNARVQVLDLDGRWLRTIGQRGLYVGNLVRPKGVAVGADGNVHVIESYHDHLLVFDEAGRFLLPIGGTGNAPGRFVLPAGAWSDAGGRIYVADMFNGRVVIFQSLAAR